MCVYLGGLRMARRFWAGLLLASASVAVYAWRDHSGPMSLLDLCYHGGVFLLALALMLPAHYFDVAFETIRAVFGKQS